MDNVRLVVISIDDILKIFQDYTHLTDSIPWDAKSDTLLFSRQDRKMCLRITADSFNGNQPPEVISFKLKKSWVA